jgi:hypothetical protein
MDALISLASSSGEQRAIGSIAAAVAAAAVTSVEDRGTSRRSVKKRTRQQALRGSSEQGNDDEEEEQDVEMHGRSTLENRLLESCSRIEHVNPLDTSPPRRRYELLSQAQRMVMGEESDDDMSVSSASEEVRSKQRKRASAAVTPGERVHGVHEEMPRERMERGVPGPLTVESLAALRREIEQGNQAHPGALGDMLENESDFHALGDPNGHAWKSYIFDRLMARIPVALSEDSVPMDASAFSNNALVDDARRHRRSLPVFGRAYQRMLLYQAGSVTNPAPQQGRPSRVVWPECCFGEKCVINSCEYVHGMPSERFPMRAFLYKHELSKLCQIGNLIVEHPCILCCRANFQHFVCAYRLYGGQVSLSSGVDIRYYTDIVDCDDGYASEFAEMPSAAIGGGATPHVVFRQHKLFCEFDNRLELWRVDDSLMYYQPPALKTTQSSEPLSSF